MRTKHQTGKLPGTPVMRVPLGRTTLSEMLQARIFPRKAVLLTFVEVCGVDLEADRRWAGPVQTFAADLRKLRQEAGNPKYLQMQRTTGRSRTALADAAGGDHLATWETVDAYVRACGGDVTEWEKRWTDVRDTLRGQREPPAFRPAASPELPLEHSPAARRWKWVLATMAVVTATAISVALYAFRTSPDPARSRLKAGTSGPAVIVIQNNEATGPATLTEDTTPAYLSTMPDPFCAVNKYEVPGTQMWSGAVLQALCGTRGVQMTNEDLQSPGISRNRSGVTSSLWYWAEMPTGTKGYISEVYIIPGDRDLLLPACSPGP
jgi:hypothetical protein